jgi:hypothetical protein
MVGHKTEVIYHRYTIADEAPRGAKKLAGLHEAIRNRSEQVIADEEARGARRLTHV